MLFVTAYIIAEGVAFGNIDQSSAIHPVTKGAAKLVPLITEYLPPGEVLVIFTPGAINPLFPIEEPKFELRSRVPYSLQLAIGISQGWLIIDIFPILP